MASVESVESTLGSVVESVESTLGSVESVLGSVEWAMLWAVWWRVWRGESEQQLTSLDSGHCTGAQMPL